jgi:iron complex transport system ATP-binding protein
VNLLEVSGLSVRLGGRTLVDSADLRVEAGQFVGLIGPNGAGKSTVVKAVLQILPYQGEVRFRGRRLRELPTRERAQNLAYLSQEDRVQWPITVEELVALGRYPHRSAWRVGPFADWRFGASDADRRAVEQALAAADVEALRARRADQLSGGERARARLARVLAVEAPLLLADEPVAALDPRHQLEVMSVLRDHCKAGGGGIVVLHDLTLASRFCDRLVLLDQGRVVAAGGVETVLSEANLAAVYGIEAVAGHRGGERYVVPWRCI